MFQPLQTVERRSSLLSLAGSAAAVYKSDASGSKNKPMPATRSTYTISVPPQREGPNGPSQPSGIQHCPFQQLDRQGAVPGGLRGDTHPLRSRESHRPRCVDRRLGEHDDGKALVDG